MAIALLSGLAAAADLPVVLRDQTGAAVRFQGARLPGAPTPNAFGGRTLGIHQTAERAVLEWESFDIRNPADEVRFHQPGSSSIALNRVKGAADVPSLINGRLTANGRVFLINHNGILFGDGARVNVHSLVASALDMDDEIFEAVGFVNAINQPDARAAFEAFGADMTGVEIVIDEGAVINGAGSGRVMVFAPTITNAGDISLPDGQIVLAAAEDKVFIAPAPRGSDIRGLLVEVNSGGDVINLGRLVAERGNVSVLGLAVNQQGMTRATTSVALNGSIMLKAQDMAGTPTFSGDEQSGRTPLATRGGELRLGPGSATEVVPDASGATALDAQRQPLSLVELGGRRVLLEGGSRVTARGGRVDMAAAVNPLAGNIGRPGDPDVSGAEVRLEEGAVVDVSGTTDTMVSVARNFVTVEARGNELADAPVQRDGPIRGETLTVDVRQGSRFLNTAGAAAGLQRDVVERLAAGGTVTIGSEGRVTVDEGATIDIRGGRVAYEGALVATSRLVTRDGRVVDIGDADPDVVYAGVLGDLEIEHEKWGVTEVFSSASGAFEPGYVEGKDAGRLVVTSPGLQLAGDLLAAAPKGRLQRRAPQALGDTPAFRRAFDQVPLGGGLVINLFDRRLPDVFVGREDAVETVNEHPAAAEGALVIPAALLNDSGLSRVDVGGLGRVIANRDLDLPAFGSLTLSGSQVLVTARVGIPGGTVALSAENLLGEPALADATARVTVTGTLDVKGRFTNDSGLVNPEPPTAAVVDDGGTVRIESARDVVIGAGAVINVDGGARLRADGTFDAGGGGAIDIRAWTNADERFASVLDIQGELRGFAFAAGGSLAIGAEAVAIVPGDGAADGVRLDGARLFGTAALGEDGPRQVFLVNGDAFARGGFGSFELTALRSGLEVAPDTDIRLVAANRLLDPGLLLSGRSATAINPFARPNGHPAAALPDGLPLDDFTARGVLPDPQRAAVDLALAAGELGPLVMGRGAAITADPGAAIALSAISGMAVDGTIESPAGTISLTNSGGKGAPGGVSRITLGDHARLSAPGAVRLDPVNDPGLITGEVLDGGRVAIRAEQGAIVGAAGAAIEVDAVSADLDVGRAGRLERRPVHGAAGEVALFAADSLAYAGSLSGQAAGNGAGGSLAVTLDPTPLNLNVVEPGSSSPVPLGPHVAVMGGIDGVLPGPHEVLDDGLRNRAFVPVEQGRAGGFHSLAVTVRSSAVGADGAGVPVPDTPDSLPVVEFPGGTDLAFARSLVLDAAVVRNSGGGDVVLRAPHVALGSSDTRVRLDGSVPDLTADTDSRNNTEVLRLTAVPGDAGLRVEAGLIELVGELVTEGFGGVDGARVELAATEGVRLRGVRPLRKNDFRGVFRAAGELAIDTPRLFPATLSEFELAVTGGRVTLDNGGDFEAVAPLSIGGSLDVRADVIRHGGNLFAPLGTLSLAADSRLELAPGSLTSTSASGVMAPFFQTQPGGDLLFPATDGGATLVFVEDVENPAFERPLPRQNVDLAGPTVDIAAGARFDLRGGGDPRAVEFVPGPGGSRDILLADLDPGSGVDPNPSFAILPGAAAFAPFDPLLTPPSAAIQGLEVGDTVVLEEGTGGLPAGEYALLPPRYALFGGYRVTPVPNTTDLAPASGVSLADGTAVVAGRLATVGGAVAGRSQGFAIEDGTAVRRRAEFLETDLADMFTSGALGRPQDAGTLAIEAGEALGLEGALVAGGVPGGRGARVDIVADAIALRQEGSGLPGIELLTGQLEGLGAESLVIGGRRTVTPEGLTLTPRARRVTVDDGVDLDVPELMLVADEVSVDPGAATRLVSSAPATGEDAVVAMGGDEGAGINGDAALLAVSNRALTLDRLAPTGAASGHLDVRDNLTLAAAGAMVADVAGDAVMAAGLEGADAVVSLGASGISLGDTAGRGIDEGLVLSNARLAALAGSDLRLRSDAPVAVFGRLFDATTGDLAFARLRVDAPGLVGVDTGATASRLVATEMELTNRSGDALAAVGAASGAGGLELAAGHLEVGHGSFRIAGFGTVDLVAEEALLVAGDGALTAEAPLAIHTPLVTGATGADVTIASAGGALSLAGGAGTGDMSPAAGLAASLLLEGDRVDLNGRVAMPSGGLTVLGRDGVEVGGDAVLDVAGSTLDFGPAAIGTGGGRIRLASALGDVRLAGGARLDVSPSSLEGTAGGVGLEAPQGEVAFGAGVDLRSGPVGGAFDLDSHGLVVDGLGGGGAYTALNDLLGGDGFTAARRIRLRGQAITLAADAVVTAHHLRAVSDTADVTIAGTLDASGRQADGVSANGGTILLAAGGSVVLEPTARLGATGAPDADGLPRAGTEGGRVELFALDGDGSDPAGTTDRVHLRAGSEINVSGRAAVVDPTATVVEAAVEPGGRVLVHTRRLDMDGDGQTETLVAGDMAATVMGAQRAQLVATEVLKDGDDLGGVTFDGTITDTLTTALRDEVAAFLAGADETVGNFRVVPGVALETAGDLVLRDDWDLFDGWHFGPAADVTGVLTLRAAGDVRLEAELSDGFFDTPEVFGGLVPARPDRLNKGVDGVDGDGNPAVLPPASWSFRIVAGADGGSAAPAATVAGAGDVILKKNTDAVVEDTARAVKAEALALFNPAQAFFWPFLISNLDDPTPDAPSQEALDLGFSIDLDLEPGDLINQGLISESSLAVNLRTGTGDIEVAAGGGVELGAAVLEVDTTGDGAVDQTLRSTVAAIVSGGFDRGLSENIREVRPGQGLLDAGFDFNRWLGNGAIFPTQGGRVTVRAGGDIVAAEAQGLPSDWLVRIGEATGGVSGLAQQAGAVPTHWGIAFQRFTGGIGALGGGEVEVRAGGDLRNVTLALPTSGRAIAGAVRDPDDPSKFGVATETTEVAGGGALRVDVGGDLLGGSLVLGDGAARVDVAGSMGAPAGGEAPTLYAGGDARVRLITGGGLNVAGIQDPTTVDLSPSQGGLLSGVGDAAAFLDNLFFTYAPTAMVDLRTLAGELTLPAGPGFARALPPALTLMSASGGLDIGATRLEQFPSPTGQLTLLAAEDLTGAGRTALVQSDEDRALLPGVALPTELGNVPEHALVPVHRDDTRPNLLVSRRGSIAATGEGFWNLQFAKSTVLEAGHDLADLRVDVQHVDPRDVSAFVAGRDIVQTTQRDTLGNFQVFDAGSSFAPKYEISGPGAAQFVAGREIALGTSQGIETVGNSPNSALPAGGADLLLMAGLGAEPSYGGFIHTVLAERDDYGDELAAFLATQGLPTDPATAVDRLGELDVRLQRQFLAGVLLGELRASGREATDTGSDDFSRGFAAIDALFPAGDPAGGISMLLSQVQTLNGGDIEMLVPGGIINAGAANADIIQKDADELGIVTATAGDIGIFVDRDLLVNSTRAFALQGDLLVWSSRGNIDAGKGAKTVSSVPNPITRIDQNGQTLIEFPPAVEGSGLQGVNAFLFAPRGVINAGDAGIRATGNLTLGATEVLGADNIDVGGISVGVPAGNVAPPPAVPTQDNVAARTTREVTRQAVESGSDSQAAGSQPLSILSVEVLGFGDG